MKSLIKYLYSKVNKLKFIIKLTKAIKGVPSPNLYWYSFLIIGVLVVFINIIIATTILPSTFSQVQKESKEKKDKLTFSKEELNKAIDLYRTKEEEFIQVKRTAPNITNLGR